jgi:hypothetical protein
MAKWGKVQGFLRKHKQANYSSMNNENAYGSKSKGKVFSIHVIKLYGGAEV